MKVFFLVGYIFPPQAYGGGNLIHRKLYTYLKEQGMNVVYISMGDLLGLLNKGWQKIGSRMPFFSKIFCNFWFCWKLRHCRGLIFTDHYFYQYLLLFKVVQRYFLKSKIIVSFFHSDYYRSGVPATFKNSLLKLRERIGYNLGDRIFTLSEHAKSEVVSVGVSPDKIKVIPPGIDPGEFIHFPKEKTNKINLLFVGHLRPRKGLEYLFKACAKLKNSNFVVNIVARKESPDYFQKLENLVKENHLEKKIIFHDEFLQDNEGRKKISRQYSQADIFVFPSLWEGFGIVLLEAMYYKLPIITTRISAMPELVKDGDNGLLVLPEDSEALARAISALIKNPALREEMGRRGYQKVINTYTWETTGEKFYQIVKELYR
ncbi:MAG: glycosyltransferase family 4 protein [Candidatus Omnitrophota bacterium]